VTLLTTLRK